MRKTLKKWGWHIATSVTIFAVLIFATYSHPQRAFAAVTQDAWTNGKTAAGGLGATVTVAHTCGAGSTFIIAEVAVNDGNQHNQQATSMTAGGAAMTKVAGVDTPNTDTRAEVWYAATTTSGKAFNVVYTYNNNNYVGVGVTCVAGADTPVQQGVATGTASTISTTTTPAIANSWLFDVSSVESSSTITGGQTMDWANLNQSFQHGQGSHKANISGATTLSWSGTSGNTWSYVVVAVPPTAAPPPTSTTNSDDELSLFQ